jgi:hypothetical protein
MKPHNKSKVDGARRDSRQRPCLQQRTKSRDGRRRAWRGRGGSRHLQHLVVFHRRHVIRNRSCGGKRQRPTCNMICSMQRALHSMRMHHATAPTRLCDFLTAIEQRAHGVGPWHPPSIDLAYGPCRRDGTCAKPHAPCFDYVDTSLGKWLCHETMQITAAYR